MNNFQINPQTQVLTTWDNREYSKLPFVDTLHENLAYELQDPEFANVIYRAYQTHLADTLTKEEAEIFGKALVQVCILMGSSKYKPKHALEKALILNGLEFAWLARNSENLDNFFKAAIIEEFHQDEPQDDRLRVCLLTTSIGGNSSVAKAIEQLCQSLGGFATVKLIDSEKIAQKHDPMKIATGCYTYESVYKEVFQQDNNPQETFKLWEQHKEIARYIPYNSARATKRKIAKFNPHVILTTNSHTLRDFTLAGSLDRPLKIVYCDHLLNFFHTQLVGKTDPKLIHFWTPSLDAHFFRHFFKDDFNGEETWLETAVKLAKVTSSSLEEVANQFMKIDFPVKNQFYRIDNADILAELKQKWDLREGEKMVVVTFGRNGVGVMKDIFADLKASPAHTDAVKYLFVCGNNSKLKEELEKGLAGEDLSQTALRRCSVVGQLIEEEMNEVMNIGSLMISKPGGAQSSEATTVGIPMYIYFAHDQWESGNEHRLTVQGLAYRHNKEQKLIEQLEARLSQPLERKSIPEWQDSFIKALLPDLV